MDKEQEASWKELRRTYDKEGIVLVLGAGVSTGSDIPNWPKLLGRLVKDSIGSDDGSLFDEMRTKGMSLPTIASILEQGCSNRMEFIERVREALYRTFCLFGADIDMASPSNQQKLVRDVCEKNKNPNPTLRAVAGLCVVLADESKQTYKDNTEHVRAVVTFNLDSLLQRYVRARFEDYRLLRTIERASKSPDIGEISVYHMHGLLRFDKKAEDPRREAPDAVVLTEQDYFDFFNDPTSLFNYTFLYLLRESSCLFIGLSMQDENIRRLLHYSRTERVRSYVHGGGKDARARMKALRHFAILKHSDSALIDSSIEDSLRALGTRVLWIDNHDKIPAQLGEMYGADWGRVFDAPPYVQESLSSIGISPTG
jgi:hypothetical protein